MTHTTIEKGIKDITETAVEIFSETTNAYDLEVCRDTLVQRIISIANSVAEKYNFSDYETPVYFETAVIETE